MIERRQFARRPVVRNALVFHPRGFFCSCSVDNISADGLFIKTTDSRLNKGSLVKVTIDTWPHDKKPITVNGLIIHKKNHGIGVICESGVLPTDLFPVTH
jgi:hypothetical protein